ncbi:methyl-accepting chemotaxis protein [Clostridium tetanomorphum]|uniref:HAMP domain-containing protein n=1 Tax=Clostridium tetanomorphum TaxID=1553 RepID=A0A923E716_CLOTT|nr:methyl-accepting chemotaxis protein [Clostridium tetanomorphum]MBC2396291.1 HAMP domain-containing protein [Clostridium tetanomorphum]NRZ96777.1 methyl-accepting chemotaxis protein [Clostridium tetanomorphum]
MRKKNAETKESSLRVKISLSALMVLLVSIVLLATIAYNVVSKKMKEQVKQEGVSLIEQIESEVQDKDKIMKGLNSLLEDKIINVAYVVGQHPKLSNDYLSKIAKETEIQEINIADKSGKIIYSNLPANINFQYKKDHSVQSILKNKSKKVVEQIRKSSNEVDKNYYKYGAIALENGGLVQVGIIANEVEKLNNSVSHQNIIDRISKKDNVVYALTVGKDFKVIAHSDKSRIGIDLKDDTASNIAIKEGKMYSSTYKYTKDNVNVYDVILPIEDGGVVTGAIDVGLSLENLEQTLKQIIYSFILVGILAFVVGGIILRSIISSNLSPLNNLEKLAQGVSKGDLTKNIDIKRKDEVGKLSISFNNMIDNLRNINLSITKISNSLKNSSESLLKSAQDSASASEEIAGSTQEIASGAENQLQVAETIVADMKDIVENIGETNSEIKKVVNLSEKTSNLAANGREKMIDMVKQMETIKESVLFSANTISELENTSQEIGNIVNIINSIADQTNLLALNASIEVARAGEAGKGFAVVAEEVKSLAEESISSSNSIKQLIVLTQDKINKALKSIEHGNMESDKGQIIVKEVRESLDEILESFDLTKGNLENVNIKISNSKDKIDNIMGRVYEIKDISSSASTNTEEVVALTEEQSSLLIQITENVEDLADMAVKLEETIKIFKME